MPIESELNYNLKTDGRHNASYWELEKLPKYSKDGVTRSISPAQTITRAKKEVDKLGVTRVSEVTGLDRIGVPNFMTVRPKDLGPGISYYNGKGTRRNDALAGALMEAVERHAGERCDYPSLLSSYERINDKILTINPKEIIVPNLMAINNKNTEIEWVIGHDLLNKVPIATPLNSVVCPYKSNIVEAIYYASTNGLASGNNLTEALCHALCEVIERDSMATALAHTKIKPAVGEILLGLGLQPPAEVEGDKHPLIYLKNLPRRASLLLNKIQKAGLSVFLRNMTSSLGIATIDCTIIELDHTGIPKVHGGCGTHPDSRVALLRAITEATQSRVACIQGGREDLPEIISPTEPYDPYETFGQGESVYFDEIPSYIHNYIDQDIELLLERLKNNGFSHVAVFDLTRPTVNIPVVRVVIPKAEAWSVFHLHTKRGVFGQRISDILTLKS